MAVVGIDFGTEFSSVTVVNDQRKIETIPDDQGKIRVSSCVSFHEDEIRVGNLAELKREVNVRNTIYDIKMLIGISLEKGKELKLEYHWPFDLTDDGNGRMQVKVHYLKSVHQFYPEEILSILFRHLIEIAEKRLRPQKVDAAVISVSTSFNHSQRKAIMDAARIAKLQVMALLNDTTAAAVCHAFMHRNRQSASRLTKDGERIMVINIGAGSFSVSTCFIHHNARVSVMSSGGESSVGGRDINRLMVAGLENNYNSTVGLIKFLDQAKNDFSSSDKRHTTIDIRSIDGKTERQVRIGRQGFKDACEYLKSSLEDCIQRTLDCRRRLDGDYEITKVILAGGSTRLPLVNELLTTFRLRGKIEKTFVKTDEIVALGAGIIAYHLSSNYRLEDLINDRLTYDVYCDSNKLLVTKDAILPASYRFETRIINEGLDIFDEDGHIMLSAEIRPSTELMFYSFDIDKDGLISILANDIQVLADGLPNSKVVELTSKQSDLRKNDAVRKIAGGERYGLERTVLQIKKKCLAIEKWLEDNQNSTVSEVQRKMQEFETILQHLSENLNPTFKKKSAKHVEDAPCCDSRKQLEKFYTENLEFQRRIAILKSNLGDSDKEKRKLEEANQKRYNEVSMDIKKTRNENKRLQLALEKSTKEANQQQVNAEREMNIRDQVIKDLTETRKEVEEQLKKAREEIDRLKVSNSTFTGNYEQQTSFTRNNAAGYADTRSRKPRQSSQRGSSYTSNYGQRM